MAARRAVGVALRADDTRAERAARNRVQRAKVALGERGTPWWEQSPEERRTRWQDGLAALDDRDDKDEDEKDEKDEDEKDGTA